MAAQVMALHLRPVWRTTPSAKSTKVHFIVCPFRGLSGLTVSGQHPSHDSRKAASMVFGVPVVWQFYIGQRRRFRNGATNLWLRRQTER